MIFKYIAAFSSTCWFTSVFMFHDKPSDAISFFLGCAMMFMALLMKES